MKTKEELNEIKEEAKKEAKPEEKVGLMLTDEDLEKVSGGDGVYVPPDMRLDGSYCWEDCCGVHDKDSCGYTFCPRGRWYGTVSNDS